MTEDRSGPAFPSFADFGEAGKEHIFGMSKRQWYAGMALSSYMQATAYAKEVLHEKIAKECFAVADAMLKEGGE